uniref:Uncharacterized protein n=1 Tax=Trichogramma kaykai TaxID=54128 RepID=A0ABD2VXM0_9HYME
MFVFFQFFTRKQIFWINITLRFHGHCIMREEAMPHIESRQTILCESIGFFQKLVSSIITQIHCRTTATSARSRTIKTRATVSSSSLYPNAKKSLAIEATAAAEASTAKKATADAAVSRQQSGIIGIIIRARRSKRGVGGGGAYARTGGLRALRAARDLLSLLLRLIYLGLLSWSSLCSWLRQGLARLPYSPVTRRPNVSGSVVGGHQSSARVVCGAGSGPHHHHQHHPHASHHQHHQRHRQHQHRRHRHLAAVASLHCSAAVAAAACARPPRGSARRRIAATKLDRRSSCKESRARETPRIAFNKNFRLLPKLILIPTLRASPLPHYTARTAAAALYASPGPSLHAHCTGGSSSSSSNYAPVPSLCAINCEVCQAYTRARYIYVERAAAAIRTRMFRSGHLMTAWASFDAIIHLWIYCYATRARGNALLQQRSNIDAIITTKWNVQILGELFRCWTKEA